MLSRGLLELTKKLLLRKEESLLLLDHHSLLRCWSWS